MIEPWRVLGHATMPDGGELLLRGRGDEYEIRSNGWELMSSRAHGSEEALARLGCADLPPAPRVLIGGLGLGFTLRAALDALPASACVVVAELVEEIIAWNRGPLAMLAGRPLDDLRVSVHCTDVAALLSSGPFNAILLDIDNGPATPIYGGESPLYRRDGLQRIGCSLAPSGTLAIWSADRSTAFEQTLSASGFTWRAHAVPARHEAEPRHTIYSARYSISRSSASISASLKPK